MAARQQRRMKNFLLDRRFQLKYAGYLVLVAVVLGAGLGLMLWRTSQSLVAQSLDTVSHGKQVVAVGKQVVAESRKVSAVVKMNIVKDPFYSDNPELLAAFKSDAAKQGKLLEEQQRALAAQATTLEQQSRHIAEEQRRTLWTLAAAMLLLVVALGLAGVVVTHKVAGPIFKMTRQIETLGAGDWRVPQPLRKGDELADFFHTFEASVKQLRERREEEIARVDAALDSLGSGAPDDLRRLRDDMAAVLGEPKPA